MAIFCQICHRPLEGATGAGKPGEDAWELARTLGVSVSRDARICEACLQKFMKGSSTLKEQGRLVNAAAPVEALRAGWGQVFVSDGPLPVGVLDLGHVGAYSRLPLVAFDGEIINTELNVTTMMKNLALARRGDAIYHFRIQLAGVGDFILVNASGCAARTGKKTPELLAACEILAPQEGDGESGN